MGSRHETEHDEIAVIVSMFKAIHSVTDISENTGVTVCSVQYWLGHFIEWG